MKRWTYLLHRWLGVLLCLFMAMWFVSGVVMMYVGYPKLTHEERLSALVPLDAQCCQVTVAQVLAAAGESRGLRLTRVAGQATFVATPVHGSQVAVDADSGLRRVQPVPAAQALQAAQAFMPGVRAEYRDRIDEDAWTHSKALDAVRPLHRIDMGDAESTLLYVSERTGEVVRDATATERAWNWVGAWIHWLYPFRGGALDRHWTDIVVYTSIVATLLALLGLLVGVWRWRFAGRYANGARSPYRESWMRWHHWVGLVFGVTTVTFIFSGLMSMNPFKVLDSGAPRVDGRARHAAALHLDDAVLTAAQALQRFHAAGFKPVELEWRRVQDRPLVLAYDSRGASRLLWADARASGEAVFAEFPMAQLEQMGRQMLAHPVRRASVLREYDFYYYRREPHTMTGGEKSLPILRLEFDDPNQTWLHLDPRTGAVLAQLDTHRRVGRWLFAFLHSWDWPALLGLRPLWDIWMWLLSLGGTALSVSGVVIGWRRLRVKTQAGSVLPS